MGYRDQHRQGFSAMLSRWTEESAVLRKKLEHEEVGICRYVYHVLGTLTLKAEDLLSKPSLPGAIVYSTHLKSNRFGLKS